MGVEKLLRVEEAAELLAVTPACIRKWITTRRVPAVKLGRAVRLRAANLEDMVKAGVRPALGRH
jgi:excisionase family DNA binding protein